MNHQNKKVQKIKPKLELETGGRPLFNPWLKAIEKFINLAERAEQAGGEIKEIGMIRGRQGSLKGIYGFSVRTGLAKKPKI